MAGVAAQSKSLTANEEFELPPYADEILIVIATGVPTMVSSASPGGTSYDVTVTELVSGKLYAINETVLPYIQCTSAAITVHYRISKR